MGLDSYIDVYDDESNELLISKHWRKVYWFNDWMIDYIIRNFDLEVENDTPVTININTLKVLLADCILIKDNPFLLEDLLCSEYNIYDLDADFLDTINYTIHNIQNIFDYCLIKLEKSKYNLVFKFYESF